MQRLRPVSITHPEHFVNVARRTAAEQPNAIFADQFENAANYRAHLKTGALWAQALRPFVAACWPLVVGIGSATVRNVLEIAVVPAGEEIWRQTGGRLDAFVSGAGTGGTIAGVSCALKARDPRVKVYLIDPPGSSLYNKVGTRCV